MPWLIALCLLLVASGVWLYAGGDKAVDRKKAYALIAAPVFLVLLLFFISHFSGTSGGASIPVADIILENPAVNEAPGASYQFTGRVHNRSAEAELGAVTIRINALDCVAGSKESCSVIAEYDLKINKRVPQGQARDISQSVVFGRERPRALGELRWRYTLLGARSY